MRVRVCVCVRVYPRFDAQTHNGERWSASRAYLWPAMMKRGRQVEVVTHMRVARVVMEGCEKDGGKCTATGVVLKRRRGGEEVVVRARKGVIITASAVHTPKLLMLSGTLPAP